MKCLIKRELDIQENECYQAELRRSQGQLLQATRDRTFLLERLMQYQNVESSASESEATDESEPEAKPEPPKRFVTEMRRLIKLIFL